MRPFYIPHTIRTLCQAELTDEVQVLLQQGTLLPHPPCFGETHYHAPSVGGPIRYGIIKSGDGRVLKTHRWVLEATF